MLWFSSSERKLALNFVHPIRCQVNSVSVHLQAVKKFIAFAGFYNTSPFCGTSSSKNTFKSSFSHQKHPSVKSYITCVSFTMWFFNQNKYKVWHPTRKLDDTRIHHWSWPLSVEDNFADRNGEMDTVWILLLPLVLVTLLNLASSVLVKVVALICQRF